ncbi:MAG: PilN domain-containing protein, partial [Candidatus Omnitrophica bacterium]|nr:PilN domain-containing protein [Candidatus Omnitrophota bacterium]
SKVILETFTKSEYLTYLNVITPLLAWKEVTISLLPEEVKLKLSFEDKSREMIKTSILVLGILVLGISIFMSKIVFKKIVLYELNKKYSFLEKEVKEIKEKVEKVNLIDENLYNSKYFLNIFSEFHEIVPIYLQIIDINFVNKNNFSVKGTAASMATVFTFVDSMENSKYFTKVKTRYATKRKDGLRDLTDFEISALLNEEVKE